VILQQILITGENQVKDREMRGVSLSSLFFIFLLYIKYNFLLLKTRIYTDLRGFI